MANTRKTTIVTGGSRGIGAGLVKAFLDRGYNVAANSRNITKPDADRPARRVGGHFGRRLRKDRSLCRLVYGVASLPLGAPVELEIHFRGWGSVMEGPTDGNANYTNRHCDEPPGGQGCDRHRRR